MRLKKLVIKNFMRIKDATLTFDGKGVVGIRAEHVSDPDRSNYLGKSTVTEAVLYNLFGRSRTKKEANLIHHGEAVMETITVWETADGQELKIRRGRESASKSGVLEANFASKKSQSQEVINDLLGVSADDFEQIFFFKQQDIHAFMAQTPDKKKQQLMGWLKNDHWREKEQRAQATVKEKKAEINRLQIDLKNAELAVGEEQEIQDQYGLTKSSLAVRKKELANLESSINKLRQSQKVDAKMVTKAQSDIDKLQFKKSQLEESLEERQVQIEKFKKLKKTLEQLGDIDAKLEQASETIFSLERDKLKLESEIESIEKVNQAIQDAKGVCPVSGQSCDLIVPKKNAKTDTTHLLEDIKKLKLHINEVKSQRQELKEALQLRSVFEGLKTKLKASENLKDQINEVDSLLLECQKIINTYDPDIQNKIDKLATEAVELSDVVHNLTKNLGVLEEKIENIEKNRKLIDELRQRLVDLNLELGDHQYIAFAFGRDGIPSLEIENSFQEIEDDVNYLLKWVNPKIRIEMQPTRELATWDDLCPACGFVYPKGYRKRECESCGCLRQKKKKDELRLVVIENGNEEDFDVCSGGLKTIVSLCVRIALSLLVKRQTNTSLSTLFLDEIDSALDNVHKEQLKMLVTTVLTKQYGFDQIFWISHDKTISNSVPHTILVKGYDSFSELEWV